MKDITSEGVELSSLKNITGFSTKLCLRVALLFLNGPLKEIGFRKNKNIRFTSQQNYVSDRVAQSVDYKTLFGPFCSFRGKTVLELGCSTGYLLGAFLKAEHFNAIGADIDFDALQHASSKKGSQIQFIQSTPISVPLPDRSVDVVYCIDTVEHLSRPRDMFLDVYRVLRPGGLFLIDFAPWFNPWGSHLEDVIPFPWPHVFFPMGSLLEVAASLYDRPDYTPACYYVDIESGKKKSNPFMDKEKWRSFLNRMTIRKFRRMIRSLPFKTMHFEKVSFGGKMFSASRYIRNFVVFPGLDEFFTKSVFCVLKRPYN